MRNVLRGAFIAVTLLSTSVQAETLAEVYQQAVENDHQFKAAKAAFEAGQEDIRIGRAGLLPQVNGNYEWSESEQETAPGSLTATPEVTPETPINTARTSEATTTGYSISLVQPLFDLSAWHTYKRGKLESRIAATSFKSEEQDLIIRTAEAYFNALRAIDNFATARAEEEANAQQLEQTQKRFEVGLTAITEVHEVQAAYDASLARRLLQEGQVGIQFEALAVITGQTYDYLSPLREQFPITPPSPAERQAWVDFSIENNFSLTTASLRAKSAEQRAKNARAQHLPTVTGRLNYYDRNQEDETGSNFDYSGNSVAISLNVPIFSGGAVSGEREKAANLYIQSQELYYKARRDTIQQARSLHLTVLTDVATVKARAQAITSSQSALEATQAGYEVGTRDLVDVLQAQRSLYSAQQQYSDALYTYVLNTMRLKQVAGILTAQDIIELDQWLDKNQRVSRDTTSAL